MNIDYTVNLFLKIQKKNYKTDINRQEKLYILSNRLSSSSSDS